MKTIPIYQKLHQNPSEVHPQIANAFIIKNQNQDEK